MAGYRIYYGLSASDLSQVVDAGVDLQSYVIDNLGRGTWYFAVRAVTQLGVESDLSQIVSKTID
ncbi:MAG: fibronectin type III domain-containing protein [Proteobacteria bacterium]|nr:fibronectin type III domain-containing protein [Pseudomonadota bacterium]